jgi:hypothetical protein
MRGTIAAAVLALGATGAQAASVSWVDLTGVSGSTATGSMSVGAQTIGVTITSSSGFYFVTTGAGTNFWTTPTSYTTTNCSAGSTCADNAPPASDIVALGNGGRVTVAFDMPVEDVYFAFTSWNGQSAVNYSTAVQVLSYGPGYWGNGTPSNVDADTIRHVGETHGTLLLPGTLSSFSFDHGYEYWHGFTVGVAGVPTGVVPVPAAGWLLLSALGGLATLRARRKAA